MGLQKPERSDKLQFIESVPTFLKKFYILHKNPTFGTFCLHFFEEIDFFHNFFVDFLNTMTYNREATVKKEGLYAEYRIGGTGDPPELR